MSMTNITECSLCSNRYGKGHLRMPCIGTCGHSICECCKHQMYSSKCPHCDREEAFAVTIINYPVLELIERLKTFQGEEESSIVAKSPIVVGEKIIQLKENADKHCKNIVIQFKKTIGSLKQYFEHFNLLSDVERNIHFNNIEANIEKVNNTISLVNDAEKRLEVLNTEFIKNAEMVEQNSKAASKNFFELVDMDQILIADRKQSAREPLLISIFNPEEESWRSVGRMPNPKSNYAVARNKSHIYIIGGLNNGIWLRNVEMYDAKRNLRRDCGPMEHGRTRTSAAFYYNKLFVVGGYDSSYMTSVEIYDPEHGDWKDGPPLQRPRADSVVVSCNGELYILGGFNGKEYEDKIEKLNFERQKFEVIGEMQGGRAGFAACAFLGRIYIAGGWSNSSNTLKSVRSYDPMTNSWRNEPSMNKERKYITLHATSKTIYAIRGCEDSWSLLSEIERFDPDRQKWDIINCPTKNQNGETQTVNEQPPAPRQIAHQLQVTQKMRPAPMTGYPFPHGALCHVSFGVSLFLFMFSCSRLSRFYP